MPTVLNKYVTGQAMVPTLKVKKLHPDAQLPVYSTPGAACFDLYAYGDHDGQEGTRLVVATGLAFEVPEGWEMVIRPRSGFAFKQGIHAFPGTIDADYRGEVMVLLMTEAGYTVGAVPNGTRIAQAKLQPAVQAEIVATDELSDTVRGEGGFGSTGQ